jgi:hypothetical protein
MPPRCQRPCPPEFRREAVSLVDAKAGESGRAARLLGAADAAIEASPGKLGGFYPGIRTAAARADRAAPRRDLGEERFREEYGRGHAMHLDEAADGALRDAAAAAPIDELTRGARSDPCGACVSAARPWRWQEGSGPRPPRFSDGLC